MKITIGSKNNVKIEALKEIVKDYDFLKDSEVVSKEVNSDVSEQPKSFDELITGAKNRAKAAFEQGLSFGVESGLAKIPHTKSGYMDFCCCAIFDGKYFHLGMSCGCEFPPKVIKRIFEEKIDVNESFFREGLTDKKKLGSYEQGAIGLLTKGKLSRKEYTKQAIVTALIHLQNKEIY